MEEECKCASDFSCSNNADRKAVMGSRHLLLLNESCSEISDNAGSIPGCIAGIAIMENLGFRGAKLFGSIHHGGYRSAAACLQFFCFEF